MNNQKLLKVWSGKCCLCDVGISTNAKSTWGNSLELHTGDIVILWHGQYINSDLEQWLPTDGLTVVVANQYKSYSDGSIVVQDAQPIPFPMGIKDCGFNHPEWRVQVVKKYSDVIAGEHWPAYGFSFNHSDIADSAVKETK